MRGLPRVVALGAWPARAGGGSIINTSSNQSLAADLSQSAYGVAKAGVNALTLFLALLLPSIPSGRAEEKCFHGRLVGAF